MIYATFDGKRNHFIKDNNLLKKLNYPVIIEYKGKKGIISFSESIALLLSKKEYEKNIDTIEASVKKSTAEVMSTYHDFNFWGMSLTLTSRCNFNCDYCSSQLRQTNLSLSFDKVKKSLDFSVTQPNVKTLIINATGGEVFTEYALLLKTLKYVKKNNPDLMVILSTNGGFPSKTKKTMKFVDEFWISFDGTPELHDKHRKLPNESGTSKKIIKTINLLKKERDIRIRCVLTKDSIGKTREIVKFLHELDVKKSKIVPVTAMGRARHGRFCLPISQGTRTSMEVEELKEELGYPAFTRLMGRPIPGRCGLTENLHIRPDGAISFCGFLSSEDTQNDPFTIGSITDSVNIFRWKEKKLQLKHFEKCRRCDFRFFCWGGCTRLNILKGNDFYEPEENHCKKLKKILQLFAEYLFERKVKKLKPRLEERKSELYYVNVFSKFRLRRAEAEEELRENPFIKIRPNDNLHLLAKKIIKHKNSRKDLTLFLLEFELGKSPEENKGIKHFLWDLKRNKVFFKILKPLPRCSFDTKDYYDIQQIGNPPNSCYDCLNLFILKNSDRAKLCTGKTLDLNRIEHRDQIYDYSNKTKNPDCKNCTFFIRKQCEGFGCMSRKRH